MKLRVIEKEYDIFIIQRFEDGDWHNLYFFKYKEDAIEYCIKLLTPPKVVWESP